MGAADTAGHGSLLDHQAANSIACPHTLTVSSPEAATRNAQCYIQSGLPQYQGQAVQITVK